MVVRKEVARQLPVFQSGILSQQQERDDLLGSVRMLYGVYGRTRHTAGSQ